MMVSKVAGIALVLIVAAPILLGYALNLTETSETGWKGTGDITNVTPLLTNGRDYNYVAADIYTLNTNLQIYDPPTPIYPIYESRSSSRSSVYSIPDSGSFNDLSTFDTIDYYYISMVFLETANYHSEYVRMALTDDNSLVASIAHIMSFSYDNNTKTISYTYRNNSNVPTGGTYTDDNGSGIRVSFTNFSWTGQFYSNSYPKTADITDPYWVDVSKGFHFSGMPDAYGILLSNHDTKSVTITINLDSITSSSYSSYIRIVGSQLNNPPLLTKTTTGGVVSWVLTDLNGNNPQELYYDPSRSDNTYQVKITLNKTEQDQTYKYYNGKYEFRYVGSWPTLIGEANYFNSYLFEKSYTTSSSVADNSIDSIQFRGYPNGSINRSFTMRVDESLFSTFEYQVIENQVYNPAKFKDNPSTTINDPVRYGTSLSFGGIDYTVSEGKITLDGKQIPVKGLTLSSIKRDDGDYDNKIGNTTISTTARPSTITFNGKWSASIVTDSMESYSYNRTEWTPGQFGWDGIDTNFLMVGLITTFGVFVLLGVYIRNVVKASIWPLILICGGAAALFFIML